MLKTKLINQRFPSFWGFPHDKDLWIYVNYSNSSQGKYHQIKNADFMRHSTASISSNVTLFISFLKTLVAN